MLACSFLLQFRSNQASVSTGIVFTVNRQQYCPGVRGCVETEEDRGSFVKHNFNVDNAKPCYLWLDFRNQFN